MSPKKTGRTAREKASMGGRARDAANTAIPQARKAGTTAVQGVKQGVEGARVWAAPRLEGAADAITASVAPKVSSALRSTARTVKPAAPQKTGIRRMLDWRWMLGIGAMMAAAGAAAAVAMKQRYQSATADAKDAADAAEGPMAPPAADATRPDMATTPRLERRCPRSMAPRASALTR